MLFGALVFIAFGALLPVYGQAIDHWETVVYDDDVWRYLVPTDEPNAAWRTLGFDDAAWNSGPGGFGYGDDDDNTVLENILSVYQRQTFVINDLNRIEGAVLHVDFDDAFVAYLNGEEIARSTIGTEGDFPSFDQPADGLHEADLYQGNTPFGIIVPKERLNAGENLLAVQTHNESTTSSDLTSRVFFSIGVTGSGRTYGDPPDWFVAPRLNPESFTSNLPIVVIDTQGRFIPDEPKILAHMGIIHNGDGVRNSTDDAFNNYDGLIGIELRGASSQAIFPKKQFAIETRDADGEDQDVSLLGFPEEEDWILQGPYSDKSLMRNVLIYHLSNQIGRYASRTRFVEVVINNDYQGVFVLMERIKRDNNRVDISTLNPDEISGDDLTGGYILKIDKSEGSEVGGWQSPHPTRPGSPHRVFYQYHVPRPSEIVPEQEAYIQGVVAAFEEVMAGSDFADPETGYTQYIDVESAIDFALLNEISRNVDGYRLSTFFYKDKDSIGGGKLVFGPIWDFNLGFGNADYYDGGSNVGFQIAIGVPETDGLQPPFWWAKLWGDSTFQTLALERWQALRQGPFHTDSVMQFIDAQAALLDEAQARNFERWPVLNQYVWPNNFVGGSYANEISFLKNWVTERMEWMDNNVGAQNVNTETPLPRGAFSLTAPYPNPFTDETTFTLSLRQSGSVEAALYDILGRRVRTVATGVFESARLHPLTVSAEGLASGIYLLHVSGPSFSTTRPVMVAR